MKGEPKKKHKPINIIPTDDDFLRIFLPMIDDEEQRRLEKFEEEEKGSISSVIKDTD